ncbi:putative disease resistance protein At1g58400 [Euphorbia lathyris]|uniref:putative disease resistance protein At1g58400 n=1 Tax=Euphorbia lathyris TaxID=212925 RepID=UPI003313F1F0
MPLIRVTGVVSDDTEDSLIEDMLKRKPQIHQGSTFPTSSSITSNREENSCSETPISNYVKLPDHLKSCFDYCCMFPYSIERGKLIRLLLAEDLVPVKPGEIMEHTAENIVTELIISGMLQQKLDRSEDELTVPISYRWLSIIQVQKQDFVTHAAGLLRAVIRVDSKGINPKMKSLPFRSLFVLTAERCGSSSPGSPRGLSRASMETICRFQFEFLLVLDLDGKVEYLPNEIGELVHLKYLGLVNSKLNELPQTIGNLQKLQTLDIRMSGYLRELPVQVLNIHQLRHLLMSTSYNDGEVRVPKGIKTLVNLYTCSGVYAGDGIASELSCLTELRELGVKRVTDEHASELFAAIMKMEKLISLTLEAEESYFEDEWFSLFPEFESFSPPTHLRELHLRGGLVETPIWLASMSSLTKLTLSSSNLQDERSIWGFQFLPKLKHLTLWEAFEGKKIGKEFCAAGGFQELQSLIIDSNFIVEWSEIENGAFPKLKCLNLRCYKLRFLPEGLENIATLEELCITPLHEDLAYRLRGEENYKIKHISKLTASPRLITRLPACFYSGSPQDVLLHV